MSFERPVGAAADAKELEYIAALIQTTDTDKEGFIDASIEAHDIKYHLMSRYGIDMSSGQVRKTILSGLGGGDDEGDCLDLCEVVAALIIPFLRKIVQKCDEARAEAEVIPASPHNSSTSIRSRRDYFQSFKESSKELPSQGKTKSGLLCEQQGPERILCAVLNNIIVRATGDSQPQPLTPELVRKIFAAYDETVLVANDQLVSDMIAAAKPQDSDPDAEDGTLLFDVETFATALTSDVMLYDPSVETRATTNFVDAFGSDLNFGMRAKNETSTTSSQPHEDDFSDEVNEQDNNPEEDRRYMPKALSMVLNDTMDGLGCTVVAENESGTISKRFAFSACDFTVDNYRSRYQTLFVWLGFVTFYARYLSDRANPRNIKVCDGDSFGCKIGQSIFNWTILMLLLCILGVLYFLVMTSGNDVYRKSIMDQVIGITGIVVFIVLPYILKFDATVFTTDVDTGNQFVEALFLGVFILVGTALFICQCLNALRLMFSEETIGNSKLLSRLLAGTNAKAELEFKQAAVYKVNKMIDNAYKLHQQNVSAKTALVQERQSTHDLALLNFTKLADKTEPVGGFLWAWKSFFNGDLKSKEGIWLHTRIYAGMYAQLILVAAVVVLGIYLFIDLIDTIMEDEVPACNVSFNPENCYAPGYNGTKIGIMACIGVILEGNGCNSHQAQGKAVETTCDYIPRIPGTNESDCDNAYIFNGQYAMATGENIQVGDCSALLFTCVVYDKLDTNTEISVCLLGMSPDLFLPYKFRGPACENISPIDDILASKPEFYQEFEELIGDVDMMRDIAEPHKPKRWMLVLCGTVGLVVGCFVALTIFVNYIPSTIATVLKFRSGIIPSLRDPNFMKYRKSLEDVTYILGLMIWGAVSSTIVSIALFAGAIFLAVWQVTRPYVVSIIALCIGIAATLTFKSLLIIVLGRINYAAFYRKRPWIGNLCGVALECWHLGITTGYMIARTAKLIVAASVYIGRIDKPFMAEDVGKIGPIHLDQFPTIYRKDLLSADAHRHPFIERLGLIYLLKIRHGSKFATTAGSIWRLLFVFSLMPWLRKYRIADDSDLPEEYLLHKLGLTADTEHEDTIKDLQEEINHLKKEAELRNSRQLQSVTFFDPMVTEDKDIKKEVAEQNSTKSKAVTFFDPTAEDEEKK